MLRRNINRQSYRYTLHITNITTNGGLEKGNSRFILIAKKYGTSISRLHSYKCRCENNLPFNFIYHEVKHNQKYVCCVSTIATANFERYIRCSVLRVAETCSFLCSPVHHIFISTCVFLSHHHSDLFSVKYTFLILLFSFKYCLFLQHVLQLTNSSILLLILACISLIVVS